MWNMQLNLRVKESICVALMMSIGFGGGAAANAQERPASQWVFAGADGQLQYLTVLRVIEFLTFQPVDIAVGWFGFPRLPCKRL